MSKLLEKAFEQASRLPEDQQDAAGAALLDYLDYARALLLTDAKVAEVRRRLADSDSSLLTMDNVETRLARLRQ
jgi:hypothetical protein